MADKVVNPIHNNQYISFFSRIPQTGSNGQNQFLKTPDLDFLNKSIKECIFPGIGLSELRIPFKGHIDTVLPGDTFRIDPINVTFSLDQSASNYKALLNWALIQKDVVSGGGRNSSFDINGVLGELVFQFIDVFLNAVFTVKFDLQVLAIPPLTFTPNTNKPDPMDFSVTFSTVNMKTLYDVQQGEA